MQADTLREYFNRYHPATVVETGLGPGGNSSCSQFVGEATVICIDLDPASCEVVQRDGCATFVGSSSEVLPLILDALEAPALFWLDAHPNGPGPTPLLDELAAIIAWEHAAASVVLIDDLAMMRNGADGCAGWPTIQEARDVADASGLWDRTEADNIMRLVPKGTI